MDIYPTMIADRLEDGWLCADLQAAQDHPLRDVRLLAGARELREDLLYIADEHDLEARGTEHLPESLVVVDGEHADVLIALRAIQDVFLDFREWDDRLEGAVIARQGVDRIIDIAAERLDNPLALFDPTSLLIHWAGTFTTDDVSGTIWEGVLSKGLSMEFFTRTEWDELTRMIDGTDGPFLTRVRRDPDHELLSCPIRLGGHLIASIGSSSINAPFTPGQIQTMRLIGRLLESALAGMDDMRYLTSGSPYHVNRLLDGAEVQERDVVHLLEGRGWGPDDMFRLLVFDYPISPDGADSRMRPYLGRVAEAFPMALTCAYDGSIVAILDLADKPIVGSASDETDMAMRVGELHERYRLQCGMASDFRGFIHLHAAFLQASAALEQGRAKGTEQALYRYPDLFVDYLREILSSAEEPEALCHPAVLRMRQDQEAHGLPLVDTVYAFLLNGRNLMAASRELHIHRNTLIYRLDRASERLDLDLRGPMSSETLLYLMVSCLIASAP